MTAKISEASLHVRRARMIDYLKLKIDEHDWHAVADAAMDLREIEAQLQMFSLNMVFSTGAESKDRQS